MSLIIKSKGKKIIIDSLKNRKKEGEKKKKRKRKKKRGRKKLTPLVFGNCRKKKRKKRPTELGSQRKLFILVMMVQLNKRKHKMLSALSPRSQITNMGS